MSKVVYLEIDASLGDKDRYGRLLRYIWLPDGRLLNLVMLTEGYAREYSFRRPYKHQDRFKQAQQEARAQNQGLWSPDTCGGDIQQPGRPKLTPSPTVKPEAER